MKRIELLAPAGDFKALKAAVNYGADAVYLGGSTFSARAFAGNFNHEEMKEAVRYCHLRGVKVYVTLNTLLNENEVENAFKEAKYYYDIGVDALIIQDLGLYYRISKEMPDFELNASTQMHIHNIEGVRNAKKLGFKKVVLARESDLEFIKEACKEDIEIETFVHGAICISYSGQCLMSAISKNRSANKGMCAQCCRLRYELYDKNDDSKVLTDTEYLLSPKDMFLLEDIPSLIEAGVRTLKIEGRMKSSAYVGLVTSVYRKAIDSYYNNEKYTLDKDIYENLLSVFNRGFTNSYLKNSSADIFGNKRPNHMGKEVGVVTSYKNGKAFIKLNKDINQFDGIRIINQFKDTGKILNTITVDGKYVAKALKNQVIEIKVDSPVKRGDIVVRTIDYKLEEAINDYELKRNPIGIEVLFKENKPIIITAKYKELIFKKTYDIYPDIAKNAPISREVLFNQFSKMNDSPFYIEDFSCTIGHAFMPKSQINEIRRQFIIDFEEFVLSSFKREMNKYPQFRQISVANKKDVLVLNRSNLNLQSICIDPIVNKEALYKSDVISEFGNILSDNAEKTAYYTLNVSNSYAYELLVKLGFKKIILSTELNHDSIKGMIESYKNRLGETIRPYVFIFGRRTLMYINRNPFVKYQKPNHKYLLKDKDNTYSLNYDNNICLIDELNPCIKENDEDLYNPFLIIDEEKDIDILFNKLHISIKDKYNE